VLSSWISQTHPICFITRVGGCAVPQASAPHQIGGGEAITNIDPKVPSSIDQQVKTCPANANCAAAGQGGTARGE
jgi:hypothetical protein